MIRPMPTMMRKVKNGTTTGGRSALRKLSSPTSRESQVPDAMKLPSFGTSIANRLRSFAGSGRRAAPRCRLLRPPARLDRRKLLRLVVVHILAGQVAEEQLHGNEHRHQAQLPVQHDPRLGAMDPAQHIPGAGGHHAHAGGQEGGEQHVRPAHALDRPVVIAHQSAGMILPSTIV